MSESSFNIENIPTFVALSVDATPNSLQRPEQFRIIQNAIIKTLSDGSLCIMDLADPLSHPQIQITYLPSTDNIQQPDSMTEAPQIIANTITDEGIQPEKSRSPIYKCPKCKDVFNKIVAYRKHMVWHRNVKKYKCDKCPAGYNVETNFKIHMATHGEGKPGKPTCPICGISFQRHASLKSHLILHQVEELYVCDECGAEFEKEEELNRHLKNHLKNTVQESSSLVCSYCNVQFEDQKCYKEHITHHIKVKKMVLSGKKSRKTNGNKNNPHVCSVCLKSFSKLSLLERHLRVHSGERPFICEHCNKGFNQKGTLQIHLTKHKGLKPYQCTLCSAKFNQKGNLRVHVEKTHTAPKPGVNMYKCPHCTCIFKKIASLNVHITKCHASSDEVGDIKSVINRLKELEQHTVVTPEMRQAEKEVTEQNRKILNEYRKSGDVPNTSYVRLAESFLDGTVRRYLVMQKKVNDMKWYICSYCNKEFKKPSDLIRHTRVHTREKPFTCKQCGTSFALKSTLFYHVKTHTEHNHVCSICMKSFSSVRSLKIHLRRHANQPQYKCILCDKWLISFEKFKLHEKRVHGTLSPSDPLNVELKEPLLSTADGLLPVAPQPQKPDPSSGKQCPVCDSKFPKMQNLKRHMLIHTGEKKFGCDQCPKTFYTAHALKTHAAYHSGVRNFACKMCGKRFLTSTLLKRHLVSHNTSKPYVCPYCSKSFKTVMLCKKHMKIHKKDVSSQNKAFNETDKLCLSTTNTESDILTQDSVQTNNAIEISSNNFQQIADPSTTIIQNQVDQQLYEVASNSIQIITSSDKILPETSNHVETIVINCDDLQLPDNLYPQSTDAILFNSLPDLQDNTFSIDNINTNFDAYDTNVNETQTISLADLNNKILKIDNIGIPSNKFKVEKTNAINANLSETVLQNNVPYYSQSELNLLFSLDTEFGTNHCDLPDINLNEVPTLSVEPKQPQMEMIKPEIKTEAKSFTCESCSKDFSNKKAYTSHMQTHKDKKVKANVHVCSFCGKNFKKASDLERHVRTHTGEKPFACDKCEKKFSLKSTLLTHQRTHNPVIHKRFNCIVCNSFFSSKSSLKVHLSVHTGDKTHKCSFCPLKFRTAAHRKSHENNYHVNPSKKRTKNKVTNLLASVAMDVLSQQENSVQNEPMITGDLENVLVVQDSMQFTEDPLALLNESTQSALSESGQLEPLIFQQLPSNILLQDQLMPSLIQLDDGTLINVKAVEEPDETLDLPFVEKERNFECDICRKRYASKDVLRKHRKIHGIDKKWRCTKCERGFDTEANLQMHEKLHDGHRPYSCLYCANSFSKEHSLTTHMKRIHNISLKDLLLI